jgi:hypothetical protein
LGFPFGIPNVIVAPQAEFFDSFRVLTLCTVILF